MARRVVITGLGPLSGLGIGIEATWQALSAGQSAIGTLSAFDAAALPCRIAAEVRDFKVNNYVPKSYRKAVKVMARDIELAVAAADLAARDAKLGTKGTLNGDAPGTTPSYPSSRIGANIGAGLIACDLDELSAALAEARDAASKFDVHKWGNHGMQQLTPLWLLKYLPNMLACHVTIIHDAQGPSNTITCAEASGGLSVGEALRIIQRRAADVSFCGGAESKLNPMAYLRQVMLDRLNTTDNDQPQRAVRSFCRTAAGTVLGEAGGIIILEALDTFTPRAAASGAKAYAEVLGFGAAQSINPASHNWRIDPQGKGIALAVKAALRDAGITPDQIDLIVPCGSGVPTDDQAETAALTAVFGSRLAQVPLTPIISLAGNCGTASGALNLCVAAQALATQTIPATINCDQPLPGLCVKTASARSATLRHVLTYSASTGGQNAALVLKKFEA